MGVLFEIGGGSQRQICVIFHILPGVYCAICHMHPSAVGCILYAQQQDIELGSSISLCLLNLLYSGFDSRQSIGSGSVPRTGALLWFSMVPP